MKRLSLHLALLATLGAVAACAGSPVTTTSSQFTRADLDRNGVLNISEYHALIDIQARDGNPWVKSLQSENPHAAEQTIQGRFSELDTNNDHVLSRSELYVSSN